MDPFDLNQILNPPPDFWFQFGKGFVAVALVPVVGYFVLALIRRGLAVLEARETISTAFAVIFISVARGLVLIAVFLVLLHQIGVTPTSVWTLLSTILAMIAVGFVAMWSILSNLLCTVMLLIFQPFRIGDEVEVIDPAMTAGVSGKVRNISLVFTTLELSSGDRRDVALIHIPNNLLFQKMIKCRSGRRSFSLDKQVFEERSLLQTDGVDAKGNENAKS